MAQSTIAILVLIITIVLFISEVIPVCVTSICAMLAMGLLGIIPWTSAFEGLSNSVIWFLIGVAILGGSFFTTGLASKIGKFIMGIGKSGIGEKGLIFILFIIGVLTSGFFNGCMVVAILFPIIDSVAIFSKGKILRKHVYLPTAVSTVFGSNISIIGSTSMMLAVAMLRTDTGIVSPFFEPAKIGLAGIIIGIIYYFSFGYKYQKTVCDFPEIVPEINDSEIDGDETASWKCWFVAILTIATIVAVAIGMDYGAAAMITAMILIITKCIDVKTAFQSINWEMIFIVVGSFGFAKGLSESGATQVIADAVLNVCGPLSSSPCAMCIVILFLATLVSNFTANGAAVAVVCPIALMIASSMGVSALPFAMATGVGANISIATAIAVPQVTMSMVAGYRSKDLIRVGGLLNLLAFVVTSISIWLFYYI